MKNNTEKKLFSLLETAESRLSSGDKSGALKICDEIFDVWKGAGAVPDSFSRRFMDLGKTPFSNFNYFIRYKDFIIEPSFVFLKKAMLRNSYLDFAKELEKFLKYSGKKDGYFSFWANFMLGNFEDSFRALERYLKIEKDIIVDDICFPLRKLEKSFIGPVYRKFCFTSPRGKFAAMYRVYFMSRSGAHFSPVSLKSFSAEIHPLEFYLRGKLFMDAVLLDEALECFSKFMRHYPHLLEARGFYAETAYLLGKRSEAFSVFRYDFSLPNLKSSSQTWLASLFLFDGSIEKAERYILKSPKNPLNLCWLGACIALGKDYAGAMKFLDAALSYRKDDAEALLWKSHCFLGLGMKKEALSCVLPLFDVDSNKIWPCIYAFLSSPDSRKKSFEKRLDFEIKKFLNLLGFLNGGKKILRPARPFSAEIFCVSMIRNNAGLRRDDNFWLWLALKRSGFFK